ncbi:toxin TumE [Leptolyngbya sp. KIOST-1]|uniref:toxin TumE n=1 Tax=Leptolyngbya sp. KIOST-1 TaxID=1229172 RepID=UPI00090791A3|nr:DUF6516 family protein [Leptolyngbya sp. KIOST-1]
MRHRLLAAYLSEVEQSIAGCRTAYVEAYREEVLTQRRANLRIRLRFNQGHLLEINEAIIVSDDELTFLDYRYHCQDRQNGLLFRYDSTPHFPDLPSYPHHKHLPDRVIACQKPSLKRVIQEAIAVGEP